MKIRLVEIVPTILISSGCATYGATMQAAQTKAPILPTSSQNTNKDIADYLNDNCKDREEAIFYIPRTDEIVPVGIDATLGGVDRDESTVEKVLKIESDVIDAHCHLIDRDAILNWAKGDDKKALEENIREFGWDKIRQRFWAEIPSPGDVFTGIVLQAKMLGHHHDGVLKNFIVILEPGPLIHVIRYSLSPEAENALRESVAKNKYHGGPKIKPTVLRDITAIYEEYEHALASLDHYRCKPFIVIPYCAFIPSSVAIKKANDNSPIRIRDEGFVRK